MNYLSPQALQKSALGRSEVEHDARVIRAILFELRSALSAALTKSTGIARELKVLDPDQVMVDFNSMFDPNSFSGIQDLFGDATHDAQKKLSAIDGQVLITERSEYASGATRL